MSPWLRSIRPSMIPTDQTLETVSCMRGVCPGDRGSRRMRRHSAGHGRGDSGDSLAGFRPAPNVNGLSLSTVVAESSHGASSPVVVLGQRILPVCRYSLLFGLVGCMV
jgi:hypothetical protein